MEAQIYNKTGSLQKWTRNIAGSTSTISLSERLKIFKSTLANLNKKIERMFVK